MVIRMHAIGFILTLLAAMTNCQTLEGGWSGIEPLVTEKVEVEKKLGITKSDGSGDYYDLGNGIIIRMNYSTDSCVPEGRDRGQYRIKKDTVLDYVVYFNNPMLFSALRFKKAEFTKKVSDHRPNEFWLLNEKIGITIIGYYREDTELEYVGKIFFKPSLRLEHKLQCKELTTTKNENV